MELHYGNLIEMLKNGEIDVLIHGCNCWHTMGAGIAKHIKTNFPQAYEADKQTSYGDKNKLGTYSQATFDIQGRKVTVINAYTQFNMGGGVDHFSYETFTKLLQNIKKNYGDKKIGLPLIGCGLAGGDEQRILSMIEEHFEGIDYKLVEIDTNRKLQYISQKKTKEYEYFFHLTSPFSNFHPSLIEYKDFKFISNEHFFMFSKAKFFKDEETAKRILNIYNEFLLEPAIFKDEKSKDTYQLIVAFLNKKIKRNDILKSQENIELWNTVNKTIKNLGRQVKNFDEKAWNEKSVKNMKFGAKLKFTQNQDLKDILLNTQNKNLVEASPYDKIWGTGLNKENSMKTDPNKWPGKNLLGQVLDNVKKEIILENENEIKKKIVF